MKNTVYGMTPQGFEELKETPDLPAGLRIICFGGYGDESEYAVTGTRDSKGRYHAVLMSRFREGAYFRARHILDEHTRPFSKKFGIGFYYDDTMDPMIYSEKEIRVALRRASIIEAYLKKKAADKAADEAALAARLPGENPHLTPITSETRYDYGCLRKNLVADLKHHFPGVKFSVRKRGHDSVTVEWTDGPSIQSYKKVMDKWEDHKTDHSGDYRDYDPSVFNNVFGGINYLFEDREWSPEITALVKDIPVWEHLDQRTFLHRLMYTTDIPAGARNLRIEETGVKCGTYESFYKVVFDMPETEQVPEEPSGLKGNPTGSLSIIEYSDKSVALIGETKSIKDRLKAMGGVFNGKLKCGPGWIFHKNRTAELVKEFGLTV